MALIKKMLTITRKAYSSDEQATYKQEFWLEEGSPLMVGQQIPMLTLTKHEGVEYPLTRKVKNWGVYHFSGYLCGFTSMTRQKAEELRGKLLTIEGIDWSKEKPLEGLYRDLLRKTGELCRSYIE